MANVLYRFYSKTGQLLYVGITMNPPQRFRDHRDSKEWWDQVAGITVESYDTRKDLAEAEKRAIRVERPQHNIVHNDKRKQLSVIRPRDAATNCTPKNPKGIVSHDHTEFANLPSWQILCQAMNTVALEASRAGIDKTQDQFSAVMGMLARTICYMDGCPECIRTEAGSDTSVASHRVDVHDGSMCARFRCADGHEWFTWFKLKSPIWELV